MNILVLRDDYYHHAEVIDVGLSFLNNDYTVDFVNTITGAGLDGYNAVILAKDDHRSKRDSHRGFMTPSFVAALRSFVDVGGGLIALHAGTVHCGFNPALKELVGSSFESHPAECPVTVNPVKQNYLTDGVVPFTAVDEHYILDISGDVDVFLESASAHGTQVAGYTKQFGYGRVVCLTPGHNLPVFDDKNYKRLIKNAVNYVLDGLPKTPIIP